MNRSKQSFAHILIFLMTVSFTAFAYGNDQRSSIAVAEAQLTFHITETRITIILDNAVTFRALQVDFDHIASAQTDSLKSIFSSSAAHLHGDTLRILVFDASGDTLLPGHYVLADIPVTILNPAEVVVSGITAVGTGGVLTPDTEVVYTPVGVFSQEEKSRPSLFHVGQNYPNPFNPSTNISLTIPHTSLVRVTIYDMLGREVYILFDGLMKQGTQILRYDGKDASGRSLSSGSYFYRVQAGSFVETKKMILLK